MSIVPQMPPAQAAELLKSDHPPRLLDVRMSGEFALAALPGAKLIPLGELPARVDEINDWRTEEILVYCHHGMRSLQAAVFLRQQGYARVTNVAGGIDRWSLEVDPALPRY